MDYFRSKHLYARLLDKSSITNNYVSWHNNKDHLKYYSSTGKVFTREFLINELENGLKTNTLFIYGLFDENNHKIIGNIKIGPISKNHKTSDLVIMIGDINYLGKGLASEGISIGNKIAFEKYKLRKLFGGMYRSNIGSVKAYLKSDWIVEGILLGHYLHNGKVEDRILVACFNPEYFDVENIKEKSLKFDDLYAK
tara:strand:+ start:1984 stop:2571 length:588 start_codon:yes stop_codon:yes gene_type:complete